MPTLTFTDGNDSYVVNAAGTFDLGFLAGDDTLDLRHASAATTAAMGDGADVVFHRAGTANVTGGAGVDRFEVYVSGLTADGGADNDLFNLRGGSGQSLAGGLGNDRFNFYGTVGSVLLHGNDGGDDFFGYGRAITGNIHGDAGNDYFLLFSNIAAVSLHGGAGDDIYRHHAGSGASFIENVGEGIDSVQVARGVSYTLGANLERISVSGFSGSTGASATLQGNGLANTITAHNNVDILFGLDGNDRLFGKGADDTLHGGTGNDYLDGGPGNDTLNGNDGNDTINGRAGADTMAGGLGDDTYYVDDAGDSITESPGAGTDTVRTTISLTLADNVERGIVTGAAGLTLTGNALANTLIGGAGADTLDGLEGDDTLVGGAGNDILRGFKSHFDGTVPDGNNTLTGGLGDDTLSGWNGQDVLDGGSGDDVLAGLEGDDTIWGGDGADLISTGYGSDDVHGGAGADVIDNVGSGVDTYHYTAVSDSPASIDWSTIDRVTCSIIDLFDFSAIDANTTVDGNQAFTLVNFGTGAAGELWVENGPSLGAAGAMIYADVDGGGADLMIFVVTPDESVHADQLIL